tara:strand:+ start:169 stop:636 length:468 start_codon:yes stop_codon:yes gene_type:complete
MNTLSLCWYFLTIIGNLPEELIVKILYEFNGLRHPYVNMLLESTKIYDYEKLQKLPLSKLVHKYYLNPTKYYKLYGKNIIQFIKESLEKERKNSYPYGISTIDPGYFIPRQFGRLFYEVNNDNLDVETYRHSSIYWVGGLLRCFVSLGVDGIYSF